MALLLHRSAGAVLPRRPVGHLAPSPLAASCTASQPPAPQAASARSRYCCGALFWILVANGGPRFFVAAAAAPRPPKHSLPCPHSCAATDAGANDSSSASSRRAALFAGAALLAALQRPQPALADNCAMMDITADSAEATAMADACRSKELPCVCAGAR